MSIYRKIISQAWKTTWQNKYLWFFGLFAMLLGNGGELEIIFRNLNLSLDQGIVAGLKSFADTGLFQISTLGNIAKLMQQDPISTLVAICVLLTMLLIGLFLVWLTVVSQAALINNAVKINYGKKHDFQDGVAVGMSKFWSVFSLNAILKILLYLTFILLSLPLLANLSRSASILNGLLFLILFIFFIPLAMSLSFITRYTTAYIIVKNEKFFDALKMGWLLFKKNWLVSLEMAFLLFAINFAVGIGLIMVTLILAVPFLFVAWIFFYWSMVFNFWTLIALAFVVFMIMVVFTGAMLSTFQTAAWTGLYLELLGAGAISKITRVFGK